MGIISDAIGAAGAVFGGISASKEGRKARRELERARRDNEAWYRRRYYEDGTQRVSAVNQLSKTIEALRQRNNNVAGGAAVSGATPEQVAAQKAAGNKAVAEATAAIAEGAEARKDAVEAAYLNTKNALSGQIANSHQQQAQQIVDATAQLGQFAASAAGTAVPKKAEAPAPTPEKIKDKI